MGGDRFVLLLWVGLVAVIADLLDEPQFASLICVRAELLAYRGALQQLLVDSNGVEELIPVDEPLLEGFFAIGEILEQLSELLEPVVQFSSGVDWRLRLRRSGRRWLELLVLDVNL